MFVAKPLRAQSAGFRLLAGLVVVCAFAGCKKDAGTVAPAATGTPTAAVAPPAQAVSAQVAAMGADALRTSASTAQREQRLYAPAGNNAMEYYLALRDKVPTDAAVTSALTDLMPYALIATEQSITRDDFTEAQRLYGLMDKADPTAPALPRLKQAIADGQASLAQRTAQAATKTVDDAKKQADLEKQRLADQQKAQQTAAQQLATQQAAAQQAATQAASQKAADDRAAATAAAARTAAAAAVRHPLRHRRLWPRPTNCGRSARRRRHIRRTHSARRPRARSRSSSPLAPMARCPRRAWCARRHRACSTAPHWQRSSAGGSSQ